MLEQSGRLLAEPSLANVWALSTSVLLDRDLVVRRSEGQGNIG